MKKTVAVCGDSWWSADLSYPGKSFGEILCNRNDWNLISMARQGSTNFAICLQIDKAIELGADFVIIGAGTPDRADFPIINDQNVSVWHKLKESFNWHNWFNTQPKVYDKSRGISNVLHTNSLSMTNPWIGDPTIISDSLNNLAFWADVKLSSEQVEALKHYMLNLYDSGIKRQYDSWIISNACRKLERQNIPYLLYTAKLYTDEFISDVDWISENKLIKPQDFFLENKLNWSSDTGFHYDTEVSGTIFADYIQQRMQGVEHES